MLNDKVAVLEKLLVEEIGDLQKFRAILAEIVDKSGGVAAYRGGGV
jgi:hypothetical protein